MVRCDSAVRTCAFRPRVLEYSTPKWSPVVFATRVSDVNKTFFCQDQDQDQDFTRTTEQVTISWSQNEQNSIGLHTTRIAVYEIKTVGLM